MLDFNHRNPSERLNFLIDAAVEKKEKKEPPRNYLGGSIIGHSCSRMLQYEYFHAPKDEDFSGRVLRIFHRGHEGEKWMATWLREIGFTLQTEQPDGGQFEFSALGGRFSGHADGIFTAGPEEFGPYPRLWENKVLGNKGFNSVARDKLKKAYPVYYAQVQLYMAYLELAGNPALFTALNADSMEIYAENVAFDPEHAQAVSDKAVNIISACDAGQLLPRVAEREDWYECKYCAYKRRCWHGSSF